LVLSAFIGGPTSYARRRISARFCLAVMWMVFARVYPEGVGNPQMDVRQEIAKQVEKLPPETQEQVLRFVASLAARAPAGEKGANLRQFASSIDSASAGQMMQAIEEECERIDAGEW
jgi:hypothetical protein